MIQYKKNRLWPILINTILALSVSIPFLTGQLTEGGDTQLHLYRIVQLDKLISQNIFYTRWAPDLAFGYGYPLFNYYAPLIYYPAEIVHLLGLPIRHAMIATFLFLLIAAAQGTYLWGKDLFGSHGGQIAATSYILSPYLFFNLLHRGALPEIAGMAILPWLFWSAGRSLNNQNRLYSFLTPLLFATLIATHNITALITAPIIALYYLILIFPQRKWYALFYHGLLLFLALGLSAWYWVPALFEKELVQIGRAFLLDMFIFSNNYLQPETLFSPLTFHDIHLLNPRFLPSINIILLLLLPLIIHKVLQKKSEHRPLIFFSLFILLVSLMMILPLSNPIWQQIPLLAFIQFPWRFLTFSNLFLALLVGYLLKKGSKQNKLIIPFIVLTSGIYAAPLTFTQQIELPANPTIEDSLYFELNAGPIGTTSTGEYLPIAVQSIPQVTIEDAPLNKQKLDIDSLPNDLLLIKQEYSPLHYQIELETETPFNIHFNTFFFPGWKATINKKEVSITPSIPHGLITFPIPTGRHNIELQFGNTPLRQAAKTITFFASILFLSAILFLPRPRSIPTTSIQNEDLYTPMSWLVSLITLNLFVWLFLHPFMRQTTHYQNNRLSYSINQEELNFSHQLELIGTQFPTTHSADQPITIDLYWRALKELDTEYSVGLVLLDHTGTPITQSNKQHIGNQPTTRWRLNQFAKDEHSLTLPYGTPPGIYTLQLVTYAYEQPDNRLNLLDHLGNPSTQFATIGSIKLTPPNSPFFATERLIPINDTFSLQDNLSIPLLLEAGEPFLLEIPWVTQSDPISDFSFSLTLSNKKNQYQIGTQPLLLNYPTSLWKQDQFWQGNYLFYTPAETESGEYTLLLHLPDTAPYLLGELIVNAPEHLYQHPELPFSSSINFPKLATLSSFSLTQHIQPGNDFPISLLWQPTETADTSYKSFVQILDLDGQFITGSDQIPGPNKRPTTGWLPDEYILDNHLLHLPTDLPNGQYQILIGFYDPQTLIRIPTENGNSAALLPITVEIPLLP